MSIEDMIEKAVTRANQPLLTRIDKLSDKLEELRKVNGETVNIAGACRLLKIDRSTFWDYRKVPGLIEPCGGTETRPVFYKADVLAIRGKIKEKKLRAA